MQQSKNIELVDPLVENSEFEFKPDTAQPGELINENLKSHQITIDDRKEIIPFKNLHLWAERFIFEFKLKTSVPAIKIDKLHRTYYGHYQPGRNGFGLLHEIAINRVYIDPENEWETLGTLLHEILHAEEAIAGTVVRHNYHKKAYRDRAKSFGLIVDQSGYTQYAPAPSPFWDILIKYGVSVPDTKGGLDDSVAISPTPIVPGNSKSKLWICECKPKPVHVRVAIEDFQAKCLKCGAIFRKQTNQLSGENSNV
jgi:hypothetical protein